MKRNLILLASMLIGCGRPAGIESSDYHSQRQGSSTGRACADQEATKSALASIELLHRQDVAATLARDPRALSKLWTDDAIRMQPGGPAEAGKRAIYVDDSTQHSLSPGTQIVRYEPVIKDVRIVGDWAVEWGSFAGDYKRFPNDSLHGIRGNLLRVLRRQSDGSWRFARVMWNSAE